jgi:hypothetical protein
MIRQIAPQFFTTDIPSTLAYYKEKLPTANPDKYADELLDAYLFIEDADALYAEYAARGVEFTRGLANMPWNSREFVVKDCDGRLLAFGANL